MVDETAVARHKARITELQDVLDTEKGTTDARRAEIEDAIAYQREAIRVLRTEAPEPKGPTPK